MTLYNTIFGVCPAADELLGALELSPNKERYGRFRDCYLRRINGELRIHLLTRNGGPNRGTFAMVTEALSLHPHFARDYEEPFDRTFLTYDFGVPESAREQVESCASWVYPEFGERWLKAVERLKREPDHPEVKRIVEALRPTLERAVASARRDGVAVLVDHDHPAKGRA